MSDVVHLAFAHTRTLGGAEEYAFKSKPVPLEVEGQESQSEAA